MIEVPAAADPEATDAMNEGLRALQDALRTPGLETAAWNGPPASFHDAMRRWWAAYDRYLAHVSGSLDVTCRKGCTWCCEDNPRGVSGVELMGVLRATDVSAREAAQHFEGLHQRHGDAAWTVEPALVILSAFGAFKSKVKTD